MGRSESLQARLADVERRLRAMRTVTNTASAEIAGGETIIDENGSIYFLDGGRLRLGGSSIITSDGKTILDTEGNLTADSVVVYGDVLSARDYRFQRETFEEIVLSSNVIQSIDEEVTLGFPDWSSSASVVTTIRITARVGSTESNPLLISLNGKPIARPRTDSLGNITLDTSVTRRVLPERPSLRLSIVFEEDTVPTAVPEMYVKMGGVFSV